MYITSNNQETLCYKVGDIMKITIISDGPWIIEMRDEIGKLSKEDANALWDYMMTSLNTTQYPEDE